MNDHSHSDSANSGPTYDPARLLHIAFPDRETEPVGERTARFAELRAEIEAQLPDVEILELLGEGGMGSVWRVRQARLGRIVALKVLAQPEATGPASAQGSSQLDERFEREARALAQMSHPNIVSIHDYGRAETFCWLLLEYVEGTTLRDLLRTGRLDPLRAVGLIGPLCDALQYAHSHGVVHRDIKPENVLVDAEGRVKVTDFGLAKVMGDSAALVSLTQPRQVLGTFRYMAPEQLDRPLEVDHRADLYSLGVVLYEMLTGEVPVGRFALPSKSAQTDPRLDDVVLRSLEPEPAKRYQSAMAMRSDVHTIGPLRTASQAARKPNHVMPLGSWLGPTLVGVSHVVSKLTGQGVELLNDRSPGEYTVFAIYSQFGVYVALGLTAFIVSVMALRTIKREWPRQIGIAGALLGVFYLPSTLMKAGAFALLVRSRSLEQIPWGRLLLSSAHYAGLALMVWACRAWILSRLSARRELRRAAA